jgi:hypothetical protein
MTRSWIGLAVIVALSAGCKRDASEVEKVAEGAGAQAQDVACGSNTCRGGQVCCNPSCGICAAPDGMCTQQFCDAPQVDNQKDQLPPVPLSCDNVRCASGTHCELVQVQCIQAPCDPVPECKPDADAGGA